MDILKDSSGPEKKLTPVQERFVGKVAMMASNASKKQDTDLTGRLETEGAYLVTGSTGLLSCDTLAFKNVTEADGANYTSVILSKRGVKFFRLAFIDQSNVEDTGFPKIEGRSHFTLGLESEQELEDDVIAESFLDQLQELDKLGKLRPAPAQ